MQRNLSNLFKLILLVGLMLLDIFLNDLGIENERFRDVLDKAIQYGMVVLFLQLLLAIVKWNYLRRKGPESKSDNVVVGLQNIYFIIVTLFTMLTIAGFWFDIWHLLTSLTVVAAAIAIISKDYLSEIISGIIITFSHEVRINDYIKVGDQKGKIIDITLTKIAMLNDDDDVIYIPNNQVYSSQIINYTQRELKKVNIEFETPVEVVGRIEDLEQDLIHELQEFEHLIVKDSYWLKVVDIKKDHLSFKFSYVLKQLNRDHETQIRKKTVRKVVDFINFRQVEQIGADQPE
ncbi:MAG TPA: mechanosensitive ion channel [Saprospiraceae bacterium]|nr:mechanosensitive ion channel [Saprospiraceae bacterium]HPG06746.1 mechanosensitive ion channel [Saprospiraceae bacterium]HQU52641.1 mechanosensitive ion channel [Saprospiraceae bacterium]HRV86127.1 mechanosensitive ion channel [Saprospiraceae bacterium]